MKTRKKEFKFCRWHRIGYLSHKYTRSKTVPCIENHQHNMENVLQSFGNKEINLKVAG